MKSEPVMAVMSHNKSSTLIPSSHGMTPQVTGVQQSRHFLYLFEPYLIHPQKSFLFAKVHNKKTEIYNGQFHID
jgi:hypothetical protein